ncbi:MAG: J domain-containing protein [Betaproteobacteria bacterium]|nr:J domain-containing protein [Betaproteobacteria bacterium]
MTNTTLHPDWVALTDRVARLKEGLALLLEEESRLLLQEQPVLFAEYQANLGALDLDQLVLDAECATLRYRVERITARKNRVEPINAEWLARLDQEVALEQAAWVERLAAREVELAKGLAGYLSLAPVDPVIHARCKQAYRRLVRLLHPDVTQDPEASRRYWQAVQEAYRAWDADALEGLLAVVRVGDETPEDAPQGLDALVQEVCRLETLTDTLRQRQTALLERIPFCYRDLLADSAQVAALRQERHEAIVRARTRRDQLAALVQTLLEPPVYH